MKTCLVALLWLCLAAQQAAADNGLIRKQSRYSVQETTDRLEARIKETGRTIWARIDFKAAAEKGDALRPNQLVIFGRGGALQPFLSRASTSGIDLPQKILVFENDQGEVWMVANTAEYVAERHGITGIPSLINGVNKLHASLMDPLAK